MATDLTSEQIQKIMQGIAIPPQPQVMVDLQMEQLNPDCSISEIARLISQDVGLSGSILKTVNSPFFKHANTITSIVQAVNLLGVNSVVNLVNALSIKGALSDDDIIAMGRFWDSSMDVAMAAAAIAKQIGYPNSDEAYTLGLFRDAGIPLLMARFENYQQVLSEAYSTPGKRVTAIENELINTNHAVVGYYVGKSWNLPAFLCQAIHEHHNVVKTFEKESSDSRKKTLLAILKMAEHVCGTHKILGQQDEDHEWNRIKEVVLVYTGLGDYDFANLAEHVNELGLGSTEYYS
ncbi:HDOD domain-containing protein [Teredinibacter sp. KSP-S5-2]|uniref:HDOD domain-containing protein n=1 Tax=Teredinibacter sp. KSP-S5-2 TaxID=3034506 RepID=UPI002934663B|nr:HDOD domain-containing protein [Teredinibacter sp. KSP-S5-2]WNO08871.1 HDOD domain-containing protein [Teredinibacter sp. KSP-S5-2]